MAVIHRKQKWTYLFEPYTASRATQRLLLKIGCVKSGAHHDGLTQMKPRFRDIAEYDICVTVRNPIDALVTRYIKNNLDKVSFDAWVKSNRIREPLSGIWRGGNTYCWYENLQEDLRYMFHRNSSNDSDFVLDYLDVDRTVGKEPWWTYPGRDTLNTLLNTFRPFMVMFGYEFCSSGGTPQMCINHDAVRKWCKPLRYHKP